MALTALGALSPAFLPQPNNPLSAQASELAKNHAIAANPAPSNGQLPGKLDSKAAKEPSLAALQLATRQVEQAVRAQASSLSLTIDQSSAKTMVRVTDRETGQLLRQIPADEMLSLSLAVDKMQGLLLSQRA